MTTLQAISILKTALQNDPKTLIKKAALFNPSVKFTIDAVSGIGTITNQAATILRSTLTGQNNAETEENQIRFAEFIESNHH